MAYKCKHCGKFVAKDAAICNHCGQENPAELIDGDLPVGFNAKAVPSQYAKTYSMPLLWKSVNCAETV